MNFKVTGSFDNPAGFAACLCAGLPFVGFLMTGNNNKYMRFSGWGVAFIIIIAVILSHSRAGIISIAVVCIILLFQKLSLKRICKYLLLGCLALLLIGCYWMKKDSADGRLLIWQCGMNMVKDSPWTGHGIDSFEVRYMDYQANYFEMYGQQDYYAMLADNVKHPFNEYLGILLNFGIIGLLILFAFILFLIYCYKGNSTVEKKIAVYALISIGIFSLFSYPFTYPFTWVVTFLSVLIITRERIKVFLSVSWRKNTVCVLALLSSMIGVYKLMERMQAELEWGRISQMTYSSFYDEALPIYEKLKKTFKDNPYFLYNYAVVLLEEKQYEKSLEIALQCRQYWADYDLELIIGENYQRLDKPELAEKYYNSASMMCPSRFLPLYKLFHLYKDNSEIEKSLAMAEAIISKPMKIKTATIRMMKREMEREIQKMNISIKHEDTVCKAGIPDCGVGLMVNITRYDGAYWCVGGLKMPGEIHVTWNGGMLKVGDEIEVEFAEFDEATLPVVEENHKSLLEKALANVDDSPERWNSELDIYYRLKKLLEDENIIKKEQ